MQRSSIPKNWKNLIEMKFKITSVPINLDAIELREFFTTYGNIHKIEIETVDGNRSNGVAYITFKPVPATPFWTKPVCFNKRNLGIEYINHYSNLFHDETDGKSKIRFNSFQAESLEMGVFLNPDTFVSEIKYNDSVNFTVDYQRRIIKIEFGVQVNEQIHLFKLELEFKNVDGEIHTVLDEKSHGLITIANKFPPRYWVLDKRLKPRDKFNWFLDDSWKRKTEIRIIPKSKEEKEVPLQPHMPDNSEQLGKWVVFRITFDLDKVEKAYIENFIGKAGLKSKDDQQLRTINGTNLRKYVNRSMLNFKVLYMVESNISFNYLHDYNLNEAFFSLLSKLPVQFAISIMETIYAKKKRIYDPLSYLRSMSSTKHNDIEFKQRHVPSHCVMMRKVVITPTTMYILIPTMETSNRVIRRFRDKKDNFLRIQFVDEASNKVSSSNGSHNLALYNRIYYTLQHGIKIGHRHYEFLAFSSSQLRDHSCWFFASTPDLTADDVRGWMGDFSSIKSVAKYAARMGQCFSSTRDILHLRVNDIREIPDVVINDYNFSDGIGKLSFSLANKIADKLELKTIPSAFQFRLAGYKGMLCQSSSVRENQIQVRPSQNKFDSNHNILEIIRCSTFIPAYLNRQAITLLTALGVPDKVFIDLKDAQVNELNKMFESESMAITILQKNIDAYGISQYLADLVKAGFLQRNDRYLINMISLFRIMMLRDLKKKAKIRVEKGAFLLGVLDETRSLKENQIYCCVSDQSSPTGRKVITGTCIVFRSPCFHPGDIRIVTAVNCKSLSNLLDVVVFPGDGYRDIPSQCSGGDLDGDDFTIIYDERLIPKRKDSDPMNYESQNPDMVSNNVTMKDIKAFFVNYILSDQLGIIANAHLAKADFHQSGAFHGQCIRLAQLHSDAVDFPKTGRPAIFPPELRASSFPDFMEKSDKSTYESIKVLGVMYRSIKEEEFEPYNQLSLDTRLYIEGYISYVEDARKLKCAYDADIKSLMNQFGIKTEFEVTSGYIINTVTNVGRKKSRDISKSVMDALTPIRQYYRKLFDEEFYGEGTNIVSPEARNRRESKASAWYYVTYHPSELKGDPSEVMISFPWIVHDVLCSIAIRNNNRSKGNNSSNGSSTRQQTLVNKNMNIFPNNNNYGVGDDIDRLRGAINQR